MDSRPSCRHGIRYNDQPFTYFEIGLVVITVIDIVVLVYFVLKFKYIKGKYETLLKKTDDELAELKKLQDTSSMQAIVPLLYLRKCKRSGDDTTNESHDANTTPKTPADTDDRANANVERTQTIVSSTQDDEGRDRKE